MFKNYLELRRAVPEEYQRALDGIVREEALALLDGKTYYMNKRRTTKVIEEAQLEAEGYVVSDVVAFLTGELEFTPAKVLAHRQRFAACWAIAQILPRHWHRETLESTKPGG